VNISQSAPFRVTSCLFHHLRASSGSLAKLTASRFVLVYGLHRLKACKALGEETIDGYLVQAVRH
jgi:hypothetical protein